MIRGLGQTADPIGQAPTRSEVEAEFDRVKRDIIGDTPIPEDMTPEAARDWGEEILRNYAANEGVPLSQSDMQEIASSWAQQQGLPVDQIPTNQKEAAAALRDASVVASAEYTGVDPRLATVTVEALLDGELTAKEMQDIGAVAGAVAGAAIAQSFGVPAPIGAFLGSKLGSLIGGTVAKIFGLGRGGPSPLQIARARLEQMNEWRDEVCEAFFVAQESYYDRLEDVLVGVNEQWTNLEKTVELRFGIRWFGVAYDFPFSEQKSTTLARRRWPGDPYFCPYDYGCPYPTYPPSGIGGGLDRVVQAFRARGTLWVPPTQRVSRQQCPAPIPTIDIASPSNPHLFERWQNDVLQIMWRWNMANARMHPSFVRVMGDLIQTAACVQAEKEVRQRREELAYEGVATLKGAKEKGERRTKLVNYGAIAVGGSTLAASLYAGRRR